jgi:DNA-binding IclR family transcriptional regulator
LFSVTKDAFGMEVVEVAGNSIEAGRTVAHKISSILLTFTQGGELALTEIARLTGLPISTAHRLTAELARQRYWNESRTACGAPAGVTNHRRRHCRPTEPGRAGTVHFGGPRRDHQMPCRLGVWRDLDVSYIEMRPDAEAATLFTTRAFLPAHPTALGRALLAFSSSCQVDRLIAQGLRSYTEHTMTSPPRLRHALAVTR